MIVLVGTACLPQEWSDLTTTAIRIRSLQTVMAHDVVQEDVAVPSETITRERACNRCSSLSSEIMFGTILGYLTGDLAHPSLADILVTAAEEVGVAVCFARWCVTAKWCLILV